MVTLFMMSLFLLTVTIIVGGWMAMTYNGLVAARNQYRNGFSQIDVQLRRRHDLIPNLVESVKGFMQHERDTLERVISARNQAAAAMGVFHAAPASAQALASVGQAEGILSGALGRLMAVSESYPELKANETVSTLLEELRSTENRIGYARQAYNDFVTGYNNRRESFPANVIAGAFSFEGASLFTLDSPEQAQAVRVNFAQQ